MLRETMIDLELANSKDDERELLSIASSHTAGYAISMKKRKVMLHAKG